MTELRVWAPRASHVDVVHDAGRSPMRPVGGGWWVTHDAPVSAGDDYAFALDGGQPLPDPRSRHQPHGVHGPSRVVDPGQWSWHDDAWRARPLAGSTIYELHIGTFTPAGTFRAATEKLDHLVDLGVDFIELLPVAAFPGRHGWGYDGVALFAVHDGYGGPEGLAEFVDKAHQRGLGVLLDVVYNHLGPTGNYLDRFGPYFTDAHHTPWGDAVNFDGEGSDEVRRFVVDNAIGWLRDYHLDGLRIDAVHAIIDTSAVHILEQLADEVDALSAHVRRPLVLIAESDLNNPRLVSSRECGGYGLDAQWSDDFHHALHSVLTGERDGYYADFGSLADLATALKRVYVYAGQHSGHRGRRHGRPVAPQIPAYRFLGYVQNHDQVGNRAAGERLSMLVSPRLLKIASALVLSAPFTPMLFMGEEWGAGTPWQYFSDHADESVAEAVRDGRRAEFAAFGWDPADVPDPQDVATCERSKLDWSELDNPPHCELLSWHQALLKLRHEHPELTDPRRRAVDVGFDEDERWLVVHRGPLRIAANFASESRRVPLADAAGTVLLASAADVAVTADGLIDLPPHTVAVVAVPCA